MKIEYNSFGDVQLEINKHREVLHPNRPDGEGNDIPESDVSGKSEIVQTVFNAMKAIPTEGNHRMISFDSNTAIIKVDGQALNPDSDVSGFNQEVQTFFNTVYSGEFDYAALYRLEEKEKQGDVPMTEIVTKPKIEIKNGKAVRRMVPTKIELHEEIPVEDESGNPVLDENGEQLMHKVPLIDHSKKLTKTEKRRLKQLRKAAF